TPTPESVTVAAADTVVQTRADTSRLFLLHVPPPGAVHQEGQLLNRSFSKLDIPDRIQSTLFDPLHSRFDGYILTGSVPGELGGLSYAAGSPDNIAYTFNGRPLSGSRGRSYDYSLYPIEFLEEAEYLKGGAGILYGGATALTTVNILQPQFDVEGSYLRLIFGKGGAASSRAEGVFARNLSRKTNLSVGFRRLFSDGVYKNQCVDGLNIYTSLLHHYQTGLTLSLTGMVTDVTRGANGGLTTESPLSSTGSSVVNDTLREGLLRHDVTATFRWIPELRGREVTDSLDATAMTRIDGNLYFSHAERSLLVGDKEALIDSLPRVVQGDMFGVNGTLSKQFGSTKLQAVVRGEIENGREGLLHGGLLFTQPISSTYTVGAGGVVTDKGTSNTSALFVEFTASVTDSFALRGTGRYIIGDGAQATNDTLLTLSGEGTAWMGELEGVWKRGETSLHLNGWIRRGVQGLSSSLNEYTALGTSVSGLIPIDFLRVNWQATGTLLPDGDERFPLLAAKGDVYIPLHLLNGALDLDIGTTVGWQSSFSGVEYEPITGRWLYPLEEKVSERQKWALIDLFASARIGTAYLNLTLYNVLDAEYRTVSRYPTTGRALRFGITWTMID
ncbi:MAG: putative porin, partial [Candidatus Kapaibacterium sp.]